MRLIDTDALTQDLAKGFAGSCGGDATLEQIVNDDTLADAIKTVEEQPTVDAEPKWIPCSEKRPSKAGHYLCSFTKPRRIDKIFVGLAYWTGSRWYGYRADEIIAWMPLPKPYEEERKEE